MTTSTHYEILGVAPNADTRTIKRAFYTLLQHNPPEQKPKEYQRLREAYDVLSNPVARREYDNMAAFGEEIEALKAKAEELMLADEPDHSQAIRLLKKAVVLGPEIGLLRNMLGLCYLREENATGALKQFTKAVEIDPENLTYLLHTGHAYSQLGKHALAEKVFRSAWERDEEDYEAPRALADLLFKQDRIDDALAVLDQAIEADGKIDFQDFFCIYDKLHVLLFSGRHDQLEAELDTVVAIAKRKEEREFASFMLARTAGELFEHKVFSLAQRFTDAAEQLDSENEALGEFAEATRQLGAFETSLKAIQDSSAYHDLVKHMISLHAVAYVEEIDEDLFEERQGELVQILDNVMEVDPESSEIKESLHKIKNLHPSVYQIYSDLYDAIISVPPARLLSKPCPYCRERITSEKNNTGHGSCPHCHKTIFFDGKQYKKSTGSVSHQTSSGSGCFVATAVYGDAQHPDVRLLRHFRDSVLLQYVPGRAFIRLYYRFGPTLAALVRPRPRIRLLVRGLLARFVCILEKVVPHES